MTKAREFSPQELAEYDGSDPTKPILLAIKGRVFDVSTGASFYGKGCSYNRFTGRDACRGLAIMSLKDQDLVPSLEGLSPSQMNTLDQWLRKFESKYPEVGTVSQASILE
mmetsp:Transcript_17769/g.30631  ORF Transcript_17769/g.30631 Transcript_17769/m.30631 type:complete len:110 (-) Transcript_17769:431-760(-)